MNSSSASGKFGFQFEFGTAPQRAAHDPDAPFRIVVLADFSGRAHRGVREPLGSRRLQLVDCDNEESVFAGFGASLTLPMAKAPGGPTTVRFESLDHFHPDQLLRRIGPLSELLTAWTLLKTPATAAQGAEDLARLLSAAPASIPAASSEATAAPESGDDTLARLLGGAPRSGSSAPVKRAGGGDIQSIIKNIVGTSSIVPAAPAGQSGLLSAAELELSARLRATLHQRDFQALEAAWRSVDWLVRRCPDEERIKYCLLDATLDELAGDLTGLHRLLRDQPPDLLLGNFTFGTSSENIAALGALAKLSASLDLTFLAAADPQLAGCDSFARHPDPDDWKFALPAEVAQAWSAFRSAEEAKTVRLAAPRFLLRQPYGAGSEPIDAFAFQEIPDASDHETFLWANPAFLLALQRAQAAVEREEPRGGEIDGLPVFFFKEAGESAMKPCAEAWLTERAMNCLVASGLIPVLSVKGRDAVLLPAV